MELEDQKVTLALSGTDNFKHVEIDDFVISLRSFQGGIERSKYAGCVSPAYTVLRSTRPVNASFMGYVLKSDGYISALQSVTDGIRDGKNISYDQFGQIGLPVPDVVEQTAIATFLDRETAKLDTLIAKQEKLIELLQEKRQALISHAVTTGLNPDVPMKGSGVEWVGDVPAHWKVLRVKEIATFITSGPRGWSERIGESGSLFIQSGDLNDVMQVRFEDAKRVEILEDAEAVRTQLNTGDVIVCITGAKTGNVAVCEFLPERAFINQHLCLIRPGRVIVSKYLGLVLKSEIGSTYFELSQYGLKQGLSLENVRDASIPLPPLDEQKTISEFIACETRKLDTLIEKSRRLIDLLREHRTALISAAVTGKIDVREAG
jgi:type I restriction enzyme S subunit